MIPARQSTAFELSVGPVLDADGVAVTDCVVGDFKLKKTTGAFAALNASATLTHVSAGTYDLVLTTSDTDTVGLLTVAIDDTTNACAPVRMQVIEEAIYDAFYAASATGLLSRGYNNVFTVGSGLTLTTLAAAKAAASAGDLIVVRPGTYDEKNLAKQGVDWHFERGAIVNYTGSANGGIWDNGATGETTALRYNVYGEGAFLRAGSGTTAVGVNVVQANSHVVIEFDRIESLGSSLRVSAGELWAKGRRIDSTDGAIDNIGGRIVADVSVILSDSYIVEVDDTAAITNLAFDHASTTGNNCLAGGSGTVILRRGVMESTHVAAEALLVDTAINLICVDGAVITPSAGTDLSISSGATARIGNGYVVDAAKITGLGTLKTSPGALRPTTLNRTLDVSDTGEAGLDFANIKHATGATTLSNITVPTVTTLMGHTPQTADHTAAIANIPTVAEFNARTILAANYSTVTTAQVNAEVDTALADYDAPTKAELDTAVAPLATGAAIADLPTNAELATALDPLATTVELAAAVAPLSTQTSVDTIDGLVDTLIARLTAARAGYLDNLNVGGVVASASSLAQAVTATTAIQAVTDLFVFTVAGKVDCNVLYVNGIQVTGVGSELDPWGP